MRGCEPRPSTPRKSLVIFSRLSRDRLGVWVEGVSKEMDDGTQLLMSQRQRAEVDPVAQAEWAQKRLVWVPNEDQGFVAASIQEESADKVTVKVVDSGKVLTLNPDDVQRMNPPKFDRVEDMAELTCLNEASVLHNLAQRYYSNQIYTYSSLFCVVINPYKKLPIYSEQVLSLYRGRKRYELPPHVYAVADTAYHSMLYDRENQSILCTGESGAGKTENTKRVIQYLVFLGCKNVSSAQAAAAGDASAKLEQQLLRANPVLEAFGNAKTVKNDNSSRFGKFIQINFDQSGLISSTNIITYILEKNRVSHQHEKERSYHIFYQLAKGAPADVKKDIMYQDLGTYKFITLGDTSVPAINDAQEYQDLMTSMEIMEIGKDDIASMFRTLSAILLLGNIDFVQDKFSDQALLPDTKVAEQVCHLLKINPSDFTKSVLKPRVKVGREFTTKTQTKAQAEFSSEALAKSLYERIFKFVVAKINRSLDKDRRSSPSFIGILDIAGFEIFEVNSFEQLCINYTNERMQQLFNHTMFILEQEEYQKEGIEWTFIDFGLDLQGTIDLLEKPMGVFGLLDEECWFPKATDKSFVEKCLKEHAKNPKFMKPDIKSKADITIVHYAGKVSYTCTAWLSKNMDPLNDNVVELLYNSKDHFVAELWKDRENIVGLNASGGDSAGPSRAKKGMFRTVGQLYKEQLSHLMSTLKSTQPNFVRCIIPNYEKKPGKITAHLVLDQLRCNGVLEGIRICRQGYPNRIMFHDFRVRYEILTPNALPQNFMDARKAVEIMLEKMEMDKNLYRIGNSKVFFKSGVLANLEEDRDKKLYTFMVVFQARVRGRLARIKHNKRTQIKSALFIIQRNIRNYFELRFWSWWRLFVRIKPLLQITRQEEEMKSKEDELKKAKDKMEKAELEVKEMESRIQSLQEEKNNALTKMQRDADTIQDMDEKLNSLTTKKTELEEVIADLEQQLTDEDKRMRTLKDELKKVQTQLKETEDAKSSLESEVQKYSLEKVQTDAKLANLEQDLAGQTETATKLQKDKKSLEEKLAETAAKLQAEEEKAKSLNKLKAKNDSSIQEYLDRIAQLEKIKSDLERDKTKLEQNINTLNQQITEQQMRIGTLEAQIQKKDQEIAGLNTRVDEESQKKNDLDRALRELQALHDEVKEELETAQAGKQKAEKQSKDLSYELENLRTELEQSLDTTAVQKDIQSKRESELNNLRKTITDEAEKHELAIAEMKSRHNQLIQELNDQLDALRKQKTTLEKAKTQLDTAKTEAEAEVERLTIMKADVDKKLKQVDASNNDAQAKLKKSEEERDTISKNYAKLKKEYDAYVVNHEQLESKLSTVESSSSKAQSQLADLQEQLDTTTKAKVSLQAKLSEAQRLLEAEKARLEEEEENSNALRSKVAEMQKTIDATKAELNNQSAGIEEIESSKKAIQKENEAAQFRIQELEDKYKKLEKSKKKLQEEVDDLNLTLEKERNSAMNLEKKQKKFDQMLAEEKTNFERVSKEKDNAEKNMRQCEAKIMTMTKQIEDLNDALAEADRAKKQSQAELATLLESKDDQGKSVHDLEKQKRALENQVQELMAEREEMEDELRISEDTKARLEVNLNALKSNFDNEINTREEALEDVRKSLTKQLRDMEAMAEEERKAKASAVSAKKKLENELKSLQTQIEDAQKGNEDFNKQMKKVTSQLKEVQREIEETRAQKEEAVNLNRANEQKVKKLESDIAKTREDFGMLEKQRKLLENERDELQAQVTKLESNQGNPEEKKRFEAAIAELNDELEDERAEKDNINARLKKFQQQVEQLTADLNNERNNSSNMESSKQSLEKQNRELKAMISDLESQVKAASKNAQLEAKVASLEEQVEAAHREKTTLQKNMRRNEAKVKDLENQLKDENLQVQLAKEQVDKANQRVKQLKNQITEHEDEISKLNLAKRKLQSELDEANENNDMLTQQVTKLKSNSSRLGGSTQKSRNLDDSD